MPDLNELLRWSIQNSTLPTSPANGATTSNGDNEQLSIRFNPASSGSSAHATALHPSDPLYQARASQVDDASPASTPGPATGVADDPVPLPPSASGAKREDLTSDMLDLIMGKSDSVEMKEQMAVALDEKNSVDDRVQALDNFEMLIELIDNANNMAVLKLWQPLLSLLQSPEDDIVAHACWIMGTAVQNNLKAQAALFLHDALPSLLSIINPASSAISREHSTAVRAKATYALSSFLKHWPLASSSLAASSSAGYGALLSNLSPESPRVLRRKTAFLVHALTLQSGEKYEGEIPNEVRNIIEQHAKEISGAGDSSGLDGESIIQGLQRTGVYNELAAELNRSEADAEADVEVQENAIRALANAVGKGLGDSEKSIAKDVWTKWGKSGQAERGLEGEDGKEISRLLA